MTDPGLPEVSFYHVTRSPVATVAHRLLTKAYGAGQRALVRLGSASALTALDKQLWEADPASFLPHGSDRNENKELQPILLTLLEENANAASVLVVLDDVWPAKLEGFSRVLYLFDGTAEDAVAAARARWRLLRDAGHPLIYQQQGEGGGWTVAARHPAPAA